MEYSNKALCIFCVLIINSTYVQSAWSQIINDSSLKREQTKINRRDSDLSKINIQGGAARGKFLFHSFKLFNINHGEEVTFDTNPDTQTIIGRITGQKKSSINGFLNISSDNPTNLILLNPSGYFFGPEANIAIRGSFTATTANSIFFENDFSFDVTKKNAIPLLTINEPLGLKFSQSNSKISISSTLFGFGGRFSFLGGEINIDNGRIFKVDGDVDLFAIDSGGSVDFESQDNNWEFNLPEGTPLLDININNESTISTPRRSSTKRGGKIEVVGNNINIDNASSLLANNSAEPDELGGISLVANKNIRLVFSIIDTSTGGGNASTNPIVLEGKSILLRNASVESESFGTQASGPINLIASDEIILEGKERLTEVDSSSFDRGDAGSIDIETTKLTIKDGAQIVSNARSRGNASQITVNADVIEISGNGLTADENTMRPSAIKTESTFTGSGGNIVIQGNSQERTNLLTITDQAAISVSRLEPFTNTNEVLGAAGDIDIKSNLLFLDNESFIAAETISGKGDINIDSITAIISDKSKVTSNAREVASGGNITINSQILFGLRNGQIVATAIEGEGGNININTNVDIFGFKKENISASSELGINGIVSISSADVDPSDLIVELPTSLSDIPNSVRQYCTSSANNRPERSNRFSFINREKFPNLPIDNTIPSNKILNSWIGIKKSSQLPIQPYSKTTRYWKNILFDSTSEVPEAETWKYNSQQKVELIIANSLSSKFNQTQEINC